MITNVFECLEQVRLTNLINGNNDAIGVIYKHPNVKGENYVVLRHERELEGFKSVNCLKGWIFTKLTK